MARLSETEYAKLVVQHLSDLGWDVYQEVPLGRGGGSVDVVAVLGRLCWAVEVKASCSWKLLEQCLDPGRQLGAHLVSAACPMPKGYGVRDAIEQAYRALGVGLLVLNPSARALTHGNEPDRYARGPVREVVRPFLRRQIASAHDLRAFLRPEHKTELAAGSPSGAGWSRFKQTCANLLAHAHAHPGTLLTDACRAIDHHYVSDQQAAQTLRRQVERGYVPGVRVETMRVGNRERLVVYALAAGR